MSENEVRTSLDITLKSRNRIPHHGPLALLASLHQCLSCRSCPLFFFHIPIVPTNLSPSRHIPQEA
ncbi:hypothetical protein S83_054592, partial [Arachis hypogaea]